MKDKEMTIGTWKGTDRRLWKNGFKDGKCPVCGCDRFQEGPGGGFCKNFRCSSCFSTCNDMGPCGIEEILLTREIEMQLGTDKFINWIDYWLVPVNAAKKQRLRRMGEVGFSIGLVLSFIVWVAIVARGAK